MLGNINIIDMTPEYIDGVMIVENLSFKIPWSRNAFLEELTSNDLASYVVALSEGRVIGYGGLWRVFNEGHITNIAVHPEFRRCGAGSKIMDRIMEICDENHITDITLEVRRSNEAAQKLYEKYGFKVEGVRKRYYSDTGEDAYIMWRHKK